MMQVYSTAFGPDDSYAIIDEHGDSFWSGELPRRLRKLLTGKHRREDVGSVAFTDSDYVVSFLDGKWEADVDEEIESALQRSGRISVFAFGPEASYVLVGTRDTYWRDIPRKMERLLMQRRAPVEMAALGYKGAWFLSFGDGHAYWGGDLAPELDGILLERKREVAKVFLSPYSRNYLVLFKDKSYSWAGTQDLTNTLDSNGVMMDPEEIMYSTSVISSEFSDGRSLYETAEELEFGDLSPHDIPAIRVVRHHGGVYALNNRRLWVFNSAGVDSVPVVVTPLKSSELRRRLHKVDGWEVTVKDSLRSAASARARRARSRSGSRGRSASVSSKKDDHKKRHRRRGHGHREDRDKVDKKRGKHRDRRHHHGRHHHHDAQLSKKGKDHKHAAGKHKKKRSRSFFKRRHERRTARRTHRKGSSSSSSSSSGSSGSESTASGSSAEDSNSLYSSSDFSDSSSDFSV